MDILRNLIVRGILVLAIAMGSVTHLTTAEAYAQTTTCNPSGVATFLTPSSNCTFTGTANQHLVEMYAPFVSPGATGTIEITNATACSPLSPYTLTETTPQIVTLCDVTVGNTVTVSYKTGGTIAGIQIKRIP